MTVSNDGNGGRDSDGRWHDLINIASIEKNDVTLVHVEVHADQYAFAIYDAPDGFHVTSAICTHAGANLCDGYFDGDTIECPLHQGYFDIRTGAALGAPATQAIKTFACRVHQGVIQVLVDQN